MTSVRQQDCPADSQRQVAPHARIFVVGARGVPDVEGGVEKNSERLFPLISGRGYHVRLIGLREHIKQPFYRGVELCVAGSVRLFKTEKLAYYVSAVLQAREFKPQLVHMQGLGAAIMLWAYKLMGFKTVVRYGLADYLLPKWGFIGRSGFKFCEFQLRFADAVIAVTPALARRLEERGIRKNVHVIGNALDQLSSFEESSVELPSTPFILAVGRVTGQKNLHRLVEAFHLFRTAHPKTCLVLAGGLDDKDYVKKLQPLLSPDVKLIGHVRRSELGLLYRNAELYVNSSIHEGNSNAILEAISWGAPSLLSDIPENRDLNVPPHHFFDASNVYSIAEALKRAYHDRSSYVIDRSSFCTWKEIADRTVDLYEELGVFSGH